MVDNVILSEYVAAGFKGRYLLHVAATRLTGGEV